MTGAVSFKRWLGGVLSCPAQLKSDHHREKCVWWHSVRETIYHLRRPQRVPEPKLGERTKQPERRESRSDSDIELGICVPAGRDSETNTPKRV